MVDSGVVEFIWIYFWSTLNYPFAFYDVGFVQSDIICRLRDGSMNERRKNNNKNRRDIDRKGEKEEPLLSILVATRSFVYTLNIIYSFDSIYEDV